VIFVHTRCSVIEFFFFFFSVGIARRNLPFVFLSLQEITVYELVVRFEDSAPAAGQNLISLSTGLKLTKHQHVFLPFITRQLIPLLRWRVAS